jgi:hypothetical protein
VPLLRFLYDFVIGDDWRIAAGVVAVLTVGAALVAAGVSHAVIVPVVGAGIVVVAAVSIVVGARRSL